MRSMTQRVPTGQRGFTLLETLLVVVLIAAIGLLAAATMTGGTDRMKLNATAKEIASELRHTRAKALATGTPQRFALDPRARRWQSDAERSGTIPDALSVAFTGAREMQPAAGVGAIVFFGDGASTGGRVQLRHGDAVWTIGVTWLTGEVTLRRGEATQ